MISYAAVVTLVQVVPPSVFTYRRVEVELPSVRLYSDPCAAEIVGAPLPMNQPTPAVPFLIPVVEPPAVVAVLLANQAP